MTTFADEVLRDPRVAEVAAALGDSSCEVRADVLQHLLGLEGPELAPYAEAVLPLVADPASDVRRRACEVIQKLEVPVLQNLKDAPVDSRMSFLRNGKAWKCLCASGSMPAPPQAPPHPAAFMQDPRKRCEGEDSWPPPPACGFDTPDTLRHRQVLVQEDGRFQGLHLEPVDWQGTFMHAPADLWEIAKNEAKESGWYHWKVRDALAFTTRDFQGTALVRLLTDSEVAVRADALVALRRLPSDLWAHHTRRVIQSLRDPIAEVRLAALCALQRLGSAELAFQAPHLVPSLHDEDAEVRAAALLTLRYLKPDQLERWAEQVLRCKLDPSVEVREAAQRAVERLSPSTMADLACAGLPKDGIFRY
ncbi:unnamed protein product [Symbiodinium sp. KB8]|nr:unnamed protein product [Symbiodinium sp. KB8]